MSKILNWPRLITFCFLGVAGMESLLILSDAGTAEVMVTSLLSLEETRVILVILSLLCASAVALFDGSNS